MSQLESDMIELKRRQYLFLSSLSLLFLGIFSGYTQDFLPVASAGGTPVRKSSLISPSTWATPLRAVWYWLITYYFY
jgi:hypothetical protein